MCYGSPYWPKTSLRKRSMSTHPICRFGFVPIHASSGRLDTWGGGGGIGLSRQLNTATNSRYRSMPSSSGALHRRWNHDGTAEWRNVCVRAWWCVCVCVFVGLCAVQCDCVCVCVRAFARACLRACETQHSRC